jgi:hypothetical protein
MKVAVVVILINLLRRTLAAYNDYDDENDENKSD